MSDTGTVSAKGMVKHGGNWKGYGDGCSIKCVGRRPQPETSLANVWAAAPGERIEAREAAFAEILGQQMREDGFRLLDESVWEGASKRDLGRR